jgi:hypothetical protein
MGLPDGPNIRIRLLGDRRECHAGFSKTDRGVDAQEASENPNLEQSLVRNHKSNYQLISQSVSLALHSGSGSL